MGLARRGSSAAACRGSRRVVRRWGPDVGHLLSQTARHAEARAVMSRLREIDPLYAMNHRDVGTGGVPGARLRGGARACAARDRHRPGILDWTAMRPGTRILYPLRRIRIAVLGARSAPERHWQPVAGSAGISRAEPVTGYMELGQAYERLDNVDLALDGLITAGAANLVGNAVKFTPSGGRVTITLERSAQHAQIIIDSSKTSFLSNQSC